MLDKAIAEGKDIEFPSPHGDKFQPLMKMVISSVFSFRPLTGINFNIVVAVGVTFIGRFRPLTGINFNLGVAESRMEKMVSVPSRG